MATLQAPLSASFPPFSPPPIYPPSQTPSDGGESGYFTMSDFSRTIIQIIRKRAVADQVCDTLFSPGSRSHQTLSLSGWSYLWRQPHRLRCERPSPYMDNSNGWVILRLCLSLPPHIHACQSKVHTPHSGVISRIAWCTTRRGDDGIKFDANPIII